MFYAPDPEPAREIIATSPKQEKARLHFLKALLEIHEIGYAGKPVENNPLQQLQNQVWPKWHERMYSHPTNTRRRDYSDYSLARESNQTEAAKILASWAIDCGLVEMDTDGSSRPAGWIAKYAEQFCDRWSTTELGQDGPLWWMNRFSELRANKKKDEVMSVEASTIKPSGIFVPMEHAAPLPGESWPQFRTRARNALNAHLQIREYTRALTGPGTIGISQVTVRAHRKTGLKLDHYLWLVLYQCCGWSLKRIAIPPYQVTARAIWEGVAEKVNLVGIKIRPRSFQKKPQNPAKPAPKNY